MTHVTHFASVFLNNLIIKFLLFGSFLLHVLEDARLIGRTNDPVIAGINFSLVLLRWQFPYSY